MIPNKAFQALACGTPLITADTPAARELLRDGESALLVPPGDPEALAAAVRRLAGEPELGAAHRRGRPRGLSRAGERGRARRSDGAASSSSSSRGEALRRRLGSRPPHSRAASARASVLRHRTFGSGRFDLGNMTQAVWSTAHGDFLSVTDVHGEQISRLGSHFDPILAALAPLWWVWPTPELLLVVQAVAVALGAMPVYWLARKHFDSEWPAARARARVSRSIRRCSG